MDIPVNTQEKFKGRPRLNSYPSPPDRFFIDKLKKPTDVYPKCFRSTSNVSQLSDNNTKQTGYYSGSG